MSIVDTWPRCIYCQTPVHTSNLSVPGNEMPSGMNPHICLGLLAATAKELEERFGSWREAVK